MTTKTDNQQLAFHAWLSRRGIASNYAGDGQYEPRVQLAWEAWTTAVDEMRPRAAVEADRRERMHDNAGCISNLSESDKQDHIGDATGMVEDHVEGVRHMVPSDEIDIADVRQYLDQWGCLAHPGVRALIDRYSSGQPAAVRCNHCGWHGADADLVRDVAADEPEDGAADVCPQCKRIGDLQDIGQPAASAKPVAHTDDDAVDHFAAAMKAKLAQARAKGRHGWQECDPSDLSQMLRAHVEKGDPRDVANFCCFLWSLGKPISAAPVAQEPIAAKRFTAATMVDLKAAIYAHHGWTRAAGESMSSRIAALYDVAPDHKAGRFVATPKSGAPVAQEPRTPEFNTGDPLLDVLLTNTHYLSTAGGMDNALLWIESLETYLAHTKSVAQEPVGVVSRAGPMYSHGTTMAVFEAEKVPVGTKLYAAPVAAQAQPLTTGQILALERRSNMADDEAIRFARSVQSALSGQPSAQDREDALTAAARDVLVERQRQIEAEGWTPEHDDTHCNSDLAKAAACYALANEYSSAVCPPMDWPWGFEFWRPGDMRRNRVKAGALILAEIERIDRAAARAAKRADHA